MQKHRNTLTSRAARIGLFLIGCAAAGLGLVVIFFLAIFGLVAACLGLLVGPLLNVTGHPAEE